MLYKVPIQIRLSGHAWIEAEPGGLIGVSHARLSSASVKCVAVEKLRVSDKIILEVDYPFALQVEDGKLPHVVRGHEIIKRRE